MVGRTRPSRLRKNSEYEDLTPVESVTGGRDGLAMCGRDRGVLTILLY